MVNYALSDIVRALARFMAARGTDSLAKRCEFGRSESRNIVSVGLRVRHPLKNVFVRVGRRGRRLPQLGKAGWIGSHAMPPAGARQ